MKKIPQYMKCPRCQLNYILKKDKFCEICKRDMRAGALDDDDLDVIEDLTLCPICKVNYLHEGETVCSTCLEESAIEDKVDASENWKDLLEKEDSTENEEELDLLPIEDSEDEEISEEMDTTFAEDLDDEFEEDEDDDFEDDFDDDFDDVDEDFDDEEDEDSSSEEEE